MFVVLRHLRAQRANLQQTPYLVSAAPVFAAVMLGHAIAARLKCKDIGVGIVHHSATPHIETIQSSEGSIRAFPSQYRGATGDIASGGVGPLQNAIQPAVTGDLDVSLILHLDQVIDLDQLRRVITDMRIRLAGGIVPQLPRLRSAETLEQAIRITGRGDWISDAAGLVKARCDTGRSIIEAVMGRVDAPGWHVPATVGYRALTRFETRPGARDGLVHAYGEAMVGLVRYDSIHSLFKEGAGPPRLWSHRWLNNSTFIVSQGDNQ